MKDYSWDFLTGWETPEVDKHSWEMLDSFVMEANKAVSSALADLQPLLVESDNLFGDLGGDPGRRDWSGFRPLESSREEDWSDWLAFLVETAKSGFLCKELNVPEQKPKKVAREVCTNEGERRADIIIHWQDANSSHIEVKVGDQSFRKTYHTSEGLAKDYSRRTWGNYILVPGRDLAALRESTAELPKIHAFTVAELTWEDIAIALRRTLTAKKEDAVWCGLAYVFCGVIEQELLGYASMQGISLEKRIPLSKMNGLLGRQNILQKVGHKNG